MFCDDDEDVMSRRCEDVVETKKINTNTFTHKQSWKEAFLYTTTFTQRPCQRHLLLHADPFQLKHLRTQKLFYTQALSYQDYCRHSVVHAQTLLHTEPFTQKRFYTKYYDLHLQRQIL